MPGALQHLGIKLLSYFPQKIIFFCFKTFDRLKKCGEILFSYLHREIAIVNGKVLVPVMLIQEDPIV